MLTQSAGSVCLRNDLQIFHALTDRDLKRVSEDQAAKRPTFGLQVFRHGFESNVVGDDRPAKLARTLQQKFVRELRSVVVLRGEDVDLSEAQLGRDGMIDVDVEIESDGHRFPPIRLGPWTSV